ncbi:MAG: FliH/SctL family protein [Planctomycetota bacterium]
MAVVHKALAVDAPIRGVRVLSRAKSADPVTRARVEWLLDLGELRRRREAEQQAVLATAQAVQQAVRTLNATVVTRLDELATQVVELGLAVARELVGDALERGAVDPTPTVVHCLRDCVHGPDGADLKVHVHPDDLGPVMAQLAAMPQLRDLVANSSLVPDASLQRGAVRAETATGRLRYDPREVFERVAQAVRSAAAGGAG